MDIKNRTLFFGDNLQILERIPDESFDLIYLDPPFNSNKDYNVLFHEGMVDSTAQIHAFEDTWEWTPATVALFDQLCRGDNPQVSLLISSLREFIHETPMMAYLVNMAARLIPLRRVLKNTGSIYLHCDTVASHYLKIMMDVIFGPEYFRNEIVWKRTSAHSDSSTCGSSHDVILFYTKGKKFVWNKVYQEYDEGYISSHYRFTDDKGRRFRTGDLTAMGLSGGGYTYEWHGVTKLWRVPLEKMKELDAIGKVRYTQSGTAEIIRYLDEMPGIPLQDIWDDIPPINSQAQERLGYPTQKPEALLERIINASSEKGQWVLDPFCGCGTTVAAAEKLERNWVGIDISMQSINVIKERISASYENMKITIDGIPMDYQAAEAMAERNKFAFQDWAITIVDASPPSGESKKGADRGIDGIILFNERGDEEAPKLRKIIVQVKGGTIHRNDVATLKGDIERENSPMGVLLTLYEPTSEMKREAALAGTYQYSNSVSFPKIQLLSVKEWFDGKHVELPTDKINPFKKAQAKIDQKTLF